MISVLKFSVLFTLLGSTLSFSAAAAEERVLLGPIPDFETMPAFHKVLKADPGQRGYQFARIEYLFERIENSPYTFIRNGKSNTSKRAAVHMRWKYLRYKREGMSAEEFVDEIANGSRKTGKDYLLQDGEQVYTSEEILHNELDLLGEALEAYKDRQRQEDLIVAAKTAAEAAEKAASEAKAALEAAQKAAAAARRVAQRRAQNRFFKGTSESAWW